MKTHLGKGGNLLGIPDDTFSTYCGIDNWTCSQIFKEDGVVTLDESEVTCKNCLKRRKKEFMRDIEKGRELDKLYKKWENENS